MTHIRYTGYGHSMAEISTEDFDYVEMTHPDFEDWREHMSHMRWVQNNGDDWLPPANDGCDNEFIEFHKFVPVNENWCGNYKGNLVEVICHRTYHAKIEKYCCWRVGVYGNDDMSMSIRFPFTDEGMKQSLDMYNRIDAFITKEELYNWGFEF